MRKLLAIDRRIIFLLVAVGVILPLLHPLNLPITVTPRVQAAFDAIDALPAGSKVLISMDYEPDIMAELLPMSIAVLRHCFRKHLQVVAMTLYPAGTGLGLQAINAAAQAEGAVKNKDYAWLGYKSGFQVVMIGIGENLRGMYPVDFYGTPLDSIPVLRGVNTYRQMAMVINLSGSSAADYWIQFAQGRFHAPLVLGCTAVMATDYYPYLSSKQILGLIGGMKGAAEYERLMDVIGDARRGMDAQSLVHLIVVGLVLVGNGALFLSRRGGPR
ncbi:MAG TPA: hypothetical protein VFD83_00495 [Candidatus Polarisedimenticolia bacterium]|nr:hypothetical protein [Candidatus Polarisedimenticolia bacterium]